MAHPPTTTPLAATKIAKRTTARIPAWSPTAVLKSRQAITERPSVVSEAQSSTIANRRPPASSSSRCENRSIQSRPRHANSAGVRRKTLNAMTSSICRLLRACGSADSQSVITPEPMTLDVVLGYYIIDRRSTRDRLRVASVCDQKTRVPRHANARLWIVHRLACTFAW